MKTTKSYVCLLITLIILASCSRTPREKAITAIVHHLEKNLKDPASYIPLDYTVEEHWSDVEPVAVNNEKNTLVMHENNSETPADDPKTSTLQGWKILHKFRCRSESGALKDTQLLF